MYEAAPFEGITCRPVVKTPHSVFQLIPRNPDQRLGGCIRKIDDNKAPFPFELPLVQQSGTGERKDRHGGSAPHSVRKRGGGPWFIMVLNEADHFLLIG
jgi:hypothetical protein